MNPVLFAILFLFVCGGAFLIILAMMKAQSVREDSGAGLTVEWPRWDRLNDTMMETNYEGGRYRLSMVNDDGLWDVVLARRSRGRWDSIAAENYDSYRMAHSEFNRLYLGLPQEVDSE